MNRNTRSADTWLFAAAVLALLTLVQAIFYTVNGVTILLFILAIGSGAAAIAVNER